MRMLETRSLEQLSGYVSFIARGVEMIMTGRGGWKLEKKGQGSPIRERGGPRVNLYAIGQRSYGVVWATLHLIGGYITFRTWHSSWTPLQARSRGLGILATGVAELSAVRVWGTGLYCISISIPHV